MGGMYKTGRGRDTERARETEREKESKRQRERQIGNMARKPIVMTVGST